MNLNVQNAKGKNQNLPKGIIKMKTPWWFLHKTPLAFLLLPIAFVYYIVSRVVFTWRKMFAYKSRRKVICIGGLLACGVGKTPIVRTLANYFDAPVVMRVSGRVGWMSKGFLITNASTAEPVRESVRRML